MALKSEREVEKLSAKGNEERRKRVFFLPGKGKGKVIFDLLDSFCYTGSRRRGGRGACWIPSSSIITQRKPIPMTSPTPPATPSPLKRKRKPKKPCEDHLPKETAKKPCKLPKEAPAPSAAVNVNKVRKSRKLPKGNASMVDGVVAPPETVTVTVTVKKRKKKTSSQLTTSEKKV